MMQFIAYYFSDKTKRLFTNTIANPKIVDIFYTQPQNSRSQKYNKNICFLKLTVLFRWSRSRSSRGRCKKNMKNKFSIQMSSLRKIDLSTNFVNNNNTYVAVIASIALIRWFHFDCLLVNCLLLHKISFTSNHVAETTIRLSQ